MITQARRAQHERWMKEALEEARRAGLRGEIPVGAVVVRNGLVVARGSNTREEEHSVLGHAELQAIAEAGRVLGDWRLSGCTLYVTLEPCPMCAGALLGARPEEVVYGAPDPVAGSLGSKVNLFAMDLGYGDPPRITAGILEEECSLLLKEFFQNRRP